MNSKMPILGVLSGAQIVDALKTLIIGAVIIYLAHGSFTSGYSIQIRKDGVVILDPASTHDLMSEPDETDQTAASPSSVH